jgi:acyl-CoA thioester hydrolase
VIAAPPPVACPTLPPPFVHELRVRYGECDPQGIVFNANYLLYFDVAFTELWRVAVGPWQEMVARGVDAVVAEANISFRAPARFDDQLELRARVTRLGSTSITTEIDVMREGELLVAGRLRHVCVETAGWSKTDLPDWVRNGLQRFASDGSG